MVSICFMIFINWPITESTYIPLMRAKWDRNRTWNYVNESCNISVHVTNQDRKYFDKKIDEGGKNSNFFSSISNENNGLTVHVHTARRIWHRYGRLYWFHHLWSLLILRLGNNGVSFRWHLILYWFCAYWWLCPRY